MENENKMIETLDENGNLVPFELLDLFEFEKKEYAILLPVEEDNGKDDVDAVLVRLIKVNGSYTFELIEDETEFQMVSDYLDSLEVEEE